MRVIPIILALLMASDASEPVPKPYCHEHVCDWTRAFYCSCGEANYIEHIPGVGLACRCPK